MDEKEQSPNEENKNVIDKKDNYQKGGKFVKNWKLKKESATFHSTEKRLMFI